MYVSYFFRLMETYKYVCAFHVFILIQNTITAVNINKCAVMQCKGNEKYLSLSNLRAQYVKAEEISLNINFFRSQFHLLCDFCIQCVLKI